MNPQIIPLNPTGTLETYEFHKHAKQADGAVWLRAGDTVMLATVTYEDEESGEDFLPLTVQYIEKSYAAGKIPGGFVKRETKPSDFETLTSRIIDRTLRPLFPKGLTAPVLITVTVFSCDAQADLQRLAVLAAQAALFTSSMPVEKSVCAVRIGKIGGELKVNPSLDELSKSTLDLFVCGSAEELMMIEMQSIWPKGGESLDSELSEAALVEAIALAQETIANAAQVYAEAFKPAAKPKKVFALKSDGIDPAVYAHVCDRYTGEIEAALFTLAKSERGGALKTIAQKACESLEATEKKPVALAVEQRKRELVREGILKHAKRADGRGLDEIRPITIDTNVLPRAHGSCLFTRGQTQALVVATLGSDSDRQSQERLTDKGQSHEKIMLHYNFPGFSVGEAKRIGPPGRRELGHGNLAKRAIESMIDPAYENTIRLVSEILESNGSSSMASVCGASMALKGADVPMKKLVAGVAMGLVTEGQQYAVLTDITGLEDHDGDMDFKVAGTADGITALQMDIKLGGLPLEVLKQALEKARVARLNILGQMQKACESIVVNRKGLPTVEFFKVDPKSIVDIIGKAGATIRDLIERYDVTIDLERESGGVKVRGTDATKLAEAVGEIHKIAAGGGGRGGKRENVISSYIPEQELPGKVVKIADFGLFIELPDGSNGLVHISKVGAGGKRIARLSDHFSEGQDVTVIFEGQDDKKKIALNLKDKL